ncbi:MAG: RND transporter, partial [Oscillospiraceae bacterium]|nr:RND transporter [Oscillospiraceae bacterium]
MSAKIKNNDSFMMKMATFIVDKRTLFFLLYVFAAIFSIVAMTWVEVENDVTVYLPEDTETRQGIVAMNENFETIASARVMVSNVTYETATQLASDMGSIDGITMVSFTDDEMHYKDACALIDVTFEKGTQDPLSVQALENIRAMLKGYDHCIDTTVGVDDMAMLLDEMMG